MNVLLIPFFLAARVAVDKPWQHGPEFTFQVQVNSTAFPVYDFYGSLRLNLTSRLICQPKGTHALSCHFTDSKADSFVAESVDPAESATPISEVSRQEAYEINQDQFEIKFNQHGLESLVVNENIQPRELDMIRMVVSQLSIGAILVDGRDEAFVMENYTQGECVTNYKVDRKIVGRTLYSKRGFALEPTTLAFKDGQLIQITKIRDLQMCTHKVGYFFGSAECFREESDIVSNVHSSISHIVLTTTEFISGTSNVITITKVSEVIPTTLHENVSLRLESIRPAEGEPPEVKDPEPASIFIGRWLSEDASSEEET